MLSNFDCSLDNLLSNPLLKCPTRPIEARNIEPAVAKIKTTLVEMILKSRNFFSKNLHEIYEMTNEQMNIKMD